MIYILKRRQQYVRQYADPYHNKYFGCILLISGTINNDINIAFQSQASQGRLQLKPTKSPKSQFRHFNSCFPSTPIQTQISRYIPSFQISFYCLSHVNFGLPLPLLILLAQLRTPQCTGASRVLLWTWPHHLNRCWTNFSSIGATPRRSRIPSFQTRSILV